MTGGDNQSMARKRKADENASPDVLPFTHYAFLRGVNVGSSNRVTMTSIKIILERQMYLSGFKTYLQSGNVALSFKSPSDGTADSNNVRNLLDALPIPTIILTKPQLAEIVQVERLKGLKDLPHDFDASKLLVQLFDKRLEAKQQDTVLDLFHKDGHHGCLLRPQDRDDNFGVSTGGDYDAIALWCPDGISRSPWFKIKWDKLLPGLGCTARNWRTLNATLALEP